MLVRAQKNESLYYPLYHKLARLHLTPYTYDKPQTPRVVFVMLLRKYLENGISFVILIQFEYDSIRVINNHRSNANDLVRKRLKHFYWVGENMPTWRYWRGYLIIDAYKQVSTFDGQQRTFLNRISPMNIPKTKNWLPTDYSTIHILSRYLFWPVTTGDGGIVSSRRFYLNDLHVFV